MHAIDAVAAPVSMLRRMRRESIASVARPCFPLESCEDPQSELLVDRGKKGCAHIVQHTDCDDHVAREATAEPDRGGRRRPLLDFGSGNFEDVDHDPDCHRARTLHDGDLRAFAVYDI